MRKVYWITGLILLVVGFFFFKPFLTGNILGEGNEERLTIPLSEITGQAKFYDYKIDGTTISFFAVKASDGSIKTGFDACDVCYSSKKGYRQEGNYMVCNNCGNKYPINGIGTENKNPGGCWPGYLPSKSDGENLLIKKSDIEGDGWMFV
ncbi:MAG: DUF2318 domain-containing protein [Nanoarchaeota archaeon]|nr:DUF2318 domain-containing protein [Nanoarchaeota archaeon]